MHCPEKDLEKFRQFLDLFKKAGFSVSPKREINFFEVTGFPRYENVMSNILSFFFDTTEQHGFGDLWLRSLLECYNKKAPKEVDVSQIETKNIEREYSNGAEKRIDLLIDAEPLLIVIENKIDAGVYNPFEIYTEMAQRYAKEKIINQYELVRIVLSVSPETIDEKLGYINITYEDLFDRLEMIWPNYQPDKKWELLAKEFINNLRRKKENTKMEIDKNWLEFVKENGSALGDLYSTIENKIDERVSVLRTINDNLVELGNRKGVYSPKTGNYVSQYVDIQVKDGFNVCIETYMMKYDIKNDDGEVFGEYDKLYIALWCRRNRSYNFSYILKALNKENAHKRKADVFKSWGEHYVLDEYELTEPLNIDEVSAKIRNYVETISKLDN